MTRAWAVLVACLSFALAHGATNYDLQPAAVADGIYVFRGRNENFNRENGGNIVNTGFIVGTTGVIVIDTGPSRLYAEQQRAAIARVTALPITRVYITHAHPDHFLGDQVYAADILAALPATNEAIRTNGDALANNLYRLVGGWMIDTHVVVPVNMAVAGRIMVGGRALRLIAAAGHTDGDLMIYDEKTKTLFTGDLVFFDRAPTTPNADVPHWLATLGEIDRLDFQTLVPGHGAVVHDHAAIVQTRDYLSWLEGALQKAANRGLDMPEVMRLPLPDRFKRLALIDSEYVRSISHLYPQIELGSLPPVNANR